MATPSPSAAGLIDPPSGPVSGTIPIRLDWPEGPPDRLGLESLCVAVGGIGVRKVSPWRDAWRRGRQEPGGPLGLWDGGPKHEFDTRKLPDGPHRITVGLSSTMAPGRAASYGRFEMLQSVAIEARNGPAPRALSVGWRELWLLPGESVALAPEILACDGSRRPAEVVASVDPAVAEVREGRLHALAPGLATAAFAAEGVTVELPIRVVAERGVVPHLTRSGRVATQYDQATSWVRRSVMNLGPIDVERRPGLADEVLAAGINCFDVGCPQVDRPGSQGDAYLDSLAVVCDRLGLGLVLQGDGWTRLDWLRDLTAAGQGRENLGRWLARLRDWGRCAGIEACDEATALMKPAAAGPVAEVFDATPGRPAVAWSVIARHPVPTTLPPWDGLNDYRSIYTEPSGWPMFEGDGAPRRLDQIVTRLTQARDLDPAKPLGHGCISVCGEIREGAPDTVPPESITACILAAVGIGASVIRAYQFDTLSWQTHPSNVGAAPEGFGRGADRWAALAAAFNLVAEFEPDLLQPMASAVDCGPEFLSYARRGPRSSLLILVNRAPWVAQARVDPTPYIEGGRTAERGTRLLGADRFDWSARTERASVLHTWLRPGEALVIRWTAPDPAAARVRELEASTAAALTHIDRAAVALRDAPGPLPALG